MQINSPRTNPAAAGAFCAAKSPRAVSRRHEGHRRIHSGDPARQASAFVALDCPNGSGNDGCCHVRSHRDSYFNDRGCEQGSWCSTATHTQVRTPSPQKQPAKPYPPRIRPKHRPSYRHQHKGHARSQNLTHRRRDRWQHRPAPPHHPNGPLGCVFQANRKTQRL